MNRPAIPKLGFLLALLLLCAGFSWIVLRLALPGAEWVAVGGLADFPPAEQPYEVFSPVHVFVVNDGSQLLVLDPLNQVPRGFNVRWHAEERAFIDPNRGTEFDLRGMPKRRYGYAQPPEKQSLPRYAIKIEGDLLYIDLIQKQVERVAGNNIWEGN
ncbi:MAG: hypothetical protein JSV61_04865 [Anaerolineales bacterium]|nr:MAG: hypothetical protein JSV61_04865 [Anaerolineales bacterium]